MKEMKEIGCDGRYNSYEYADDIWITLSEYRKSKLKELGV